MTPRQRVTTALTGGTPDHVPFIPQICVPHAVRMLGLPYEETLLDVIRHPQRMDRLSYQCAKAYGVDGMRAWMPGEPLDGVKVDGHWHGRDPETGEVLGRVDFQGGGGVLPSEEPMLVTDEDIDAIPVPTADEIVDSGHLEGIRAITEEAGEDMVIISSAPQFTVEYLTFTLGKARALMDLHDRPQFCHRALEKALAVAITHARALVKVGVRALMVADVYGGVVGPRHFSEFCVPYFQRFVQAVRPLGVPVYMHVCGQSWCILELMADTGVDCIEPLDPLGGVSVADAKRRVGDRVALMGGLDTRLLAHGSMDQVRADAVRCLTEGMPGGGYLLACGDMLPTETHPDKVHMLVEMARTVGSYQ